MDLPATQAYRRRYSLLYTNTGMYMYVNSGKFFPAISVHCVVSMVHCMSIYCCSLVNIVVSDSKL